MTSEEEFLAGFARAGLQPPVERLDLMVRAFEDYRALAMLLHAPVDYSAEPVGLYKPVPSAESGT